MNWPCSRPARPSHIKREHSHRESTSSLSDILWTVRQRWLLDDGPYLRQYRRWQRQQQPAVLIYSPSKRATMAARTNPRTSRQRWSTISRTRSSIAPASGSPNRNVADTAIRPASSASGWDTRGQRFVRGGRRDEYDDEKRAHGSRPDAGVRPRRPRLSSHRRRGIATRRLLNHGRIRATAVRRSECNYHTGRIALGRGLLAAKNHHDAGRGDG